jgi:hypothetical protein
LQSVTDGDGGSSCALLPNSKTYVGLAILIKKKSCQVSVIESKLAGEQPNNKLPVDSPAGSSANSITIKRLATAYNRRRGEDKCRKLKIPAKSSRRVVLPNSEGEPNTFRNGPGLQQQGVHSRHISLPEIKEDNPSLCCELVTTESEREDVAGVG